MTTRPILRKPDMAQPEYQMAHTSDTAHYARILLTRLWLIILLVLATEASVVAFSYSRPLTYQTSVRFQITTLPPSDVTLYQNTRSTSSSVDPLTATRTDFISVLTSEDVAWDTLDALKLPLSGQEVQQMTS